MIFQEPIEILPMDQGDISKGLGGYTIPSVTDPSVDLNIFTSDRYKLEQSNNIEIMRTLFYNQPITKTPIDADIGNVITMSNKIVHMETNYIDHVIRKQYEANQDIFTLSNKLCRAPVQHSLISAKCMIDAAILKGKSYKVGWGRGFTLATIFSEAVNGVSHVSSTLETFVYTPTQILLVDISESRHQKKETDPFMHKLPRFMEIVLENSTCVLETIKCPRKHVPRWEIKIGYELTEQLCDYWATHKDDCPKINPKLNYYKNIFDLCLKFWGPIEGPHPPEVVRKELFNIWLENVTEELMNAHLNKIGSYDSLNKIMVYLSGHKIKEAAKLAASNKMPHLSLLLSQLNSNKNTRYCIGFQVRFWEDSRAIDFIGENHLKLYILCCGVLYYKLINACEGLDWLRALGMHLWYQAEITSSLKHCVEMFENAFCGEAPYTAKPHPLFGSAEYSWDIMYYLMKLYCNEKLDLDVILSPATHTNDCIDYRLSWFLMQTLHSLQVGVLSKNANNEIITLFATQLEQLGHFKWAIFAVLFLKDMRMRENLVYAILDRNLTDSPYDRKIEIELVERLNVPLNWIHRIKSLKTKQLQRYWEAYRHLAHAQLWNELHDLFVEKTLPTLIANQHIPLLKGILTDMKRGQNEIVRWKTCGGFLLEFVTLWLEIEQNIHCADPYQYKQFYRSINKFAWKIYSYPITDLSQNMIISIISQKTAELFNNLLGILQIEKKIYIEMTSNLLHRLIMPNDLKYEKFCNLLLSYKKL